MDASRVGHLSAISARLETEMTSSKAQIREAKRMGLSRAIETAEDDEVQKRARELRRENIRRAAAANRPARGFGPAWGIK